MDELEITPAEVKARLDRGENLVLVDVREPWEHVICRIEGAKLIPMAKLPSNLPLFEQAGDVVLYCHYGIRSLEAATWLRGRGVEGAQSLAGGIERWANEIDPGVPHY
jgi:adenylyltransferase/sulfurtransferase